MAQPQLEKDAYVLNRDHAAAARLNYQFFLWRETLGFNLHPDIPAPKPDARIADVATGTGIWLIDVARSLPNTVQFQGLDIDISQCPPKQWLPSNMKTRAWDMFQEVPKDLVGQFDIVHVRLLGLVIKDNNSLPAIASLHKLLKPGGYLQWDEMADASSYVASVDSTIKTDGVEALRKYMNSPKGNEKGLDNWRSGLPDNLNQNGFVKAKLHTYKPELSLAKFWNDNFLLVVEEFTSKVFKGTDKAAEAYQLLNNAVEDVHHGAVIVIPLTVVVAMKRKA